MIKGAYQLSGIALTTGGQIYWTGLVTRTAVFAEVLSRLELRLDGDSFRTMYLLHFALILYFVHSHDRQSRRQVLPGHRASPFARVLDTVLFSCVLCVGSKLAT